MYAHGAESGSPSSAHILKTPARRSAQASGMPESTTERFTMSHDLIPAERKESLRNGLQATADALYRRKASEISDASIEDYVNLNWLEWWGGTLRLTTTGQNICRQMQLSPESRHA
jgi:hypothetical protein